METVQREAEVDLEPFTALGVPVVDQAGRTADDDPLSNGLPSQGFVPVLEKRPKQCYTLQNPPAIMGAALFEAQPRAW